MKLLRIFTLPEHIRVQKYLYLGANDELRRHK